MKSGSSNGNYLASTDQDLFDRCVGIGVVNECTNRAEKL